MYVDARAGNDGDARLGYTQLAQGATVVGILHDGTSLAGAEESAQCKADRHSHQAGTHMGGCEDVAESRERVDDAWYPGE